LTTKLHALVDALGNPVRGLLSAGNVHDVTQAESLLDGIQAQQVVADKAYDSRLIPSPGGSGAFVCDTLGQERG